MIDMLVGFSLLAFKHKRVESIWTRRPGNIKDVFDCDLADGESEGEIVHKIFFCEASKLVGGNIWLCGVF